MTGRRTLIVGSYPPVEVPAAEATLDAVRRAWADGDEVTVVSPRPSAAHLAVPIAGPLAGRRLDRMRRRCSAERLVLCVEPGVPFPSDGHPGLEWRRSQTASRLATAMRAFDHVTLVVVGDIGAGQHPLAALRQLAVLQAASDEERTFPVEGARWAPGVTALGPNELRPRDWPRRLAGIGSRAVLGGHAGQLRAWLAGVRRSLRSTAGLDRRPR